MAGIPPSSLAGGEESETRNQRGEVVQTTTVKLLVPRRSKMDGAMQKTEGG